MLIALLFLLAVGMVLLIVAVLATRRQLWLGRQALAPVENLPRSCDAPIVSVPSLAGDTVTIGGTSRDPRFLLLLFLEAGSSACETMVGDAVDLCSRADVRLLLLGNGTEKDYAEILSRNRVAAGDFILNSALEEDFMIGLPPSAVLIDARGQLVARGTVQRRDQLERLLHSAAPRAANRGPPAVRADAVG